MDRTSFYEWKRRFQMHGLEVLKDLPPIPKSQPNATTPKMEARILETSLAYLSWDCVKLSDFLKLQGGFTRNMDCVYMRSSWITVLNSAELPIIRLNFIWLSMILSTAALRFEHRGGIGLLSVLTALSSINFSGLPSGRTFTNRLTPYRTTSMSGLAITTQNDLTGAIEIRGNALGHCLGIL